MLIISFTNLISPTLLHIFHFLKPVYITILLFHELLLYQYVGIIYYVYSVRFAFFCMTRLVTKAFEFCHCNIGLMRFSFVDAQDLEVHVWNWPIILIPREYPILPAEINGFHIRLFRLFSHHQGFRPFNNAWCVYITLHSQQIIPVPSPC